MKPTKTDKSRNIQHPPTSGSDGRSRCPAIAQEDPTFAERKDTPRRAIWDRVIGELKTIILELASLGIQPHEIAAALGFSHSNEAPSGGRLIPFRQRQPLPRPRPELPFGGYGPQ